MEHGCGAVYTWQLTSTISNPNLFVVVVLSVLQWYMSIRYIGKMFLIERKRYLEWASEKSYIID